MSDANVDVTIIIPCFNEEAAIEKTLGALLSEKKLLGCKVIVIDDGSTDATAEKIKKFADVKLIRHGLNKGYGSSIASGCRATQSKYVVWMDGDGQHRTEDVVRVVNELVAGDFEWVIGCRDKKSHQVSSRKFGKFILKQCVRVVIGENELDFNSGLRGFQTSVLSKYLSFIEGGFGASTTTTLLMKKALHYGTSIDITVMERSGSSSVRQLRDGMRSMLLIFKIAMLFSPLKIIGGLGLFQFTVGIIYGFFRAVVEHQGFPILSVIITISGIQTIFVGLVLDQMANIRFALNEK